MRTVSFDTETKGFEWWNGETAFIITAAVDKATYCFDACKPDETLAFQRLLCGADRIVAHNLSFDTHQLRATIGLDLLDLDAELHDTDLMARVFLPEGKYGEHGGFGLKKLAKVFLDPNADVDEDGIKEAAKAIGMKSIKKTGAYYDVWRAYPDVMERYARSDAKYTLDLFNFLLAMYEKDEKLASVYDLERAVIPMLIRAEQRGTSLYQPAVKRLHKQYLREQRSLHESLATQLGEQALGGEGSEDALVEALQKNGVPLTERTESGKLATHKGVFDRLAGAHPVVAELQEYRHVSKFLSTYIEPMLKTDVIHPSIKQIGTWTGRMSCMRPNMQNIPVRSGSEIREPIIPRAEHKLVVIDYDSIEARLLAYYLGAAGQPFRDLINEGGDPMAWLAGTLAERGVAPWAGNTDFTKGGPNDKLRSLAKTIMYAIIYGAGGCKLCDYLGLPKGPPLTADDWLVKRGFKDVGDDSCVEGGDVGKAVKAAMPGYNALMRRIRNKIEGHGYVSTLLGRKQAVDPEKAYVGMSALIQGSAADVMKAGLVRLNPVLDAFDAHLLMVVHDEVVIEAPETKAADVLHHGSDALTSAVTLDPPLLTSGGIFDNYGEAK